MIVSVMQEHIQKGRRGDSGMGSNLHNPLVYAIQDVDGTPVVVTPTMVHRICGHGLACKAYWCGVVPLPEYARQWLTAYYANKWVTPFQFTL